MNKQTLILVALATAFSVTASADPGKGPHDGKAENMRPDGKPHPLLRQVDANKDGEISKTEVDAVQARRFAAIDTDGNGEVSREDILAQARERAEERLQRMADMQIDRLDENGDGVVSQEEFNARSDQGFARRDANNDGVLTRGELRPDGPRGPRNERQQRRGPRESGEENDS
ncbi:MAG: EF-hand domain-containing protein [Gammaproteobacteria bacterium]|nr:EF-hand domain-containing protein [Gammaproteobacteria bacterium]